MPIRLPCIFNHYSKLEFELWSTNISKALKAKKYVFSYKYIGRDDNKQLHLKRDLQLRVNNVMMH